MAACPVAAPCEPATSLALANGRCSWASCSLADSGACNNAVVQGSADHRKILQKDTITSMAAGLAAPSKFSSESNGRMINGTAAANHHPDQQQPAGAPIKTPSCILGIGTANPDRTINMHEFGTDIIHGFGYDDIPEVVEFTKRICNSSGITKKQMAFSHDLYMNNPTLKEYGYPSLDTRFKLFESEAMKIGELAAERAISDWGGDRSHITHLITYSTTGMLSPAIDMRLIKALGLPQTTKHFWVSLMGCHAGLIGIRTAAEIAQADPKNRVLVVCMEINSLQAQPLNPECIKEMNNMVVSIIFADGAAGIVVGMQPTELETPIFEIDRCQTSYIPDTDHCITAKLTQSGLHAGLDKSVPLLVGKNAGRFVKDMLQGTSLKFEAVNWAVHPGGKAVVDAVERGCQLLSEQLRFSRYILDNYANMSSPTILFVLDKIREAAHVATISSTIDHQQSRLLPVHDWTVVLGFGPGLTMEGILLKNCC